MVLLPYSLWREDSDIFGYDAVNSDVLVLKFRGNFSAFFSAQEELSGLISGIKHSLL